jgi:predicted metal-dependent hydrolase
VTGATYRIRRSDRARRARITVSEEGEAVVVLPRRAPLAMAALLVEEHAGWLERHVARARAARARLDERLPLEEGRVLVIGGDEYRISAVDGVRARPARGRVEVSEPGLGLQGRVIVRLGRDGRATSDLLEGWLRARAATVIAQRVATFAPALGVSPGAITVRDQKTRWASASPSGALSFSWRLLLAPSEVLDAVVVHELAHLRIRGHSRSFWALVERHAPQTPAARRWLREHAREMRRALD